MSYESRKPKIDYREMSSKRLRRSFFNRPTLKVAQELLGKYLVFNNLAGRITEVEAYIGESDPACHACRGETPRNTIMFGKAGVAYIYFIYGMYFCLNVVTEKKGFPSAVLIRALEPKEGIAQMIKNRNLRKPRTQNLMSSISNGPGKLCQALGLTREQNGVDLVKSRNFYIEDREDAPEKIIATPRIGIKKGEDKLWRFVIGK